MAAKKSNKAPKKGNAAKPGRSRAHIDPNMQQLADLLRKLASGPAAKREAFLAAFGNKSPDPDPVDTMSPQEAAQELAFDAMEAPTKAKALALTRRALKLDPDCVDALVSLSLFESKTPEQAVERLKAAVAAGERSLGRGYFRKNKGYFWGLQETRPYMRARHQLADMLLEAERFDEAIGHFEAMLELNPNDNQGIRELLLGAYLTVSNLEGARRVLTTYDGDCGAVFAWGRVLERILSQQFTEAEVALRRARKGNRFVELYLTGVKKIPRTAPDMYSPGSMEEAQLCLESLSGVLAKHPHAIFWLMAQLMEMDAPKIGRLFEEPSADSFVN
jgi:tetratricopeptide (TPR) repeat protein